MAEKNDFSRLPDVPACSPPETRSFLNKLSRNQTNVLNPIRSMMEALFGDTFQNVVDNGDYATLIDNSITNIAGAPRMAKAQGAMTGGVISMKLYGWDVGGAVYAVSGSAFNARDVFDRWSHALTDDLGLVLWDSVRGEYVVAWMASPATRRGTLDAALTRDGNANMTDANDSRTISVNGYLVPTGKKIPSGSRVKAEYDVLMKKWLVGTTDVCVVNV